MDLLFDGDDDGGGDDGALVVLIHPLDPNRMAVLACQALRLKKISIIEMDFGTIWLNTYRHIQADR